MKYNYTLPKQPVYTVAASAANQITKQYYDFLVGEINRGTIKKAVCKAESLIFGSISYYLISL